MLTTAASCAAPLTPHPSLLRCGQLQVMLLGLSTTTLLFGFSSSLEMALVVRFVGGLSAGGRELTQVMATELCQGCPEHQAKAMSTNAAMWGLAVIVGPALGGLLARPAINVRLTRRVP
jgi:MFS family permease